MSPHLIGQAQKKPIPKGASSPNRKPKTHAALPSADSNHQHRRTTPTDRNNPSHIQYTLRAYITHLLCTPIPLSLRLPWALSYTSNGLESSYNHHTMTKDNRCYNYQFSCHNNGTVTSIEACTKNLQQDYWLTTASNARTHWTLLFLLSSSRVVIFSLAKVYDFYSENKCIFLGLIFSK